jgi:hypothetical protein
VEQGQRGHEEGAHNSEEEAEVERVVRSYCLNLGVSLPPWQLDALRDQVRQLVRQQMETEEDEDEDENEDEEEAGIEDTNDRSDSY